MRTGLRERSIRRGLRRAPPPTGPWSSSSPTRGSLAATPTDSVRHLHARPRRGIHRPRLHRRVVLRPGLRERRFLRGVAGRCAKRDKGLSSPPGEQLSAADTDVADDIYARDLPGGPTVLVSQGDSSCAPACGNSGAVPVLHGTSADGSRVFFTTAEPLAVGDEDTATDVYARDLPGGSDRAGLCRDRAEPHRELRGDLRRRRPRLLHDDRVAGSRRRQRCHRRLQVVGRRIEPDHLRHLLRLELQRLHCGCGDGRLHHRRAARGRRHRLQRRCLRADGDRAPTLASEGAASCAPGCGNGGAPAIFSKGGVSSDGSKVFFTTGEQLSSQDLDEDDDIYMRDLSAGATELSSPPPGLCPLSSCDVVFSGISTDRRPCLLPDRGAAQLRRHRLGGGRLRALRAAKPASSRPATRRCSARRPRTGENRPTVTWRIDHSQDHRPSRREHLDQALRDLRLLGRSGCDRNLARAGERRDRGHRRRRLDDELPGDRHRLQRRYFAMLAAGLLQPAERVPASASGRSTPATSSGHRHGWRAAGRTGSTSGLPQFHSGGIAFVTPETQITFGPAFKTRKRRAVFRFVDATGQPGTRFVCKLDRRTLALLQLAGAAEAAAPGQACVRGEGGQRGGRLAGPAREADVQGGAVRRLLNMRLASEESGLTLIELLVASAMSVVLLGAVGAMVISAMRTQPEVSKRAQNVSSARYVMERLTREIRNGVAVDSATASSVSFRTYVRRTALRRQRVDRPQLAGDRLPGHLQLHDDLLRADRGERRRVHRPPGPRRRSSAGSTAATSSPTRPAQTPRPMSASHSASPTRAGPPPSPSPTAPACATRSWPTDVSRIERRERGFTIVEVIVATLILTIGGADHLRPAQHGDEKHPAGEGHSGGAGSRPAGARGASHPHP